MYNHFSDHATYFDVYPAHFDHPRRSKDRTHRPQSRHIFIFIVYYDLEQLTKALAHATGYVVEINNLCRQLKDHADFGIICDGAVAEITHLMTDIQRKYKFLNPNYRSKRALLNVIGTISK